MGKKKQVTSKTKSSKGNNKKTTYSTNIKNSESNDVQKLITLIIIIVVILGIIYLITSAFEKKDYSSIFNNSLETTEIQYQEIMIGTLFQQKEDEYYVVVIDDKDSYTEALEEQINTYRESDSKIKMYTIDLNNIFNKQNKADKSSFSKDDLKFKGNTFLKIKDGEIVSTIEGTMDINKKMLELNY